MAKFKKTSLYATSAILMLSSAEGFASDVNDEEPVPRLPKVRPLQERAEIKPMVGMFIGGEAGILYDDNINKDRSDGDSDLIVVLRPELSLRSDLDRHEFIIRSNIEHGNYIDNSRNNYTDFDLRGQGRYDISDISALHGYMRYRFDHIEIGSLNDEPERDLSEPITYHYGEIGAYHERRPEDYKYQLGAEARIYDYMDIRRLDGSESINDDRDRTEFEGWTRFGKYIEPEMLPYFELRANTRRYREQVDGTIDTPRDSDGFKAGVGVELGSKDSIYFVDAFIGYLAQNYDDDAFEDINAAALGIEGFWQIDDKWRLKGELSRTVEETTSRGISGYLRTRARIGADYYLSPQWLLGGWLRITENDFEANPDITLGRVDMIYDGNIGARYQFAESLAVGLEYTYTKRESDRRRDLEYGRNMVMLRLIAADF